MFVIRSICILELDIAVLVTPVKCYTRTRSVKRLKQHEMLLMSASLHVARVWTQNLFMKRSWHDVLHPMWLPSFCSTWMKKNERAEPPAEFSLYSRSLSSSLVCPQTKCRHTSINLEFLWRKQLDRSSTVVSWLCYQQKNVSSTTSKSLAVIAKWVFHFSTSSVGLEQTVSDWLAQKQRDAWCTARRAGGHGHLLQPDIKHKTIWENSL